MRRWNIMLTKLRAGYLFTVSLVFYLIIIVFVAISTVLQPDRWSERTRLAKGAR